MRFALLPTYFFFFKVSTVTVVLTVLSLTTCIVSFVTTFEVSLVLTSSVVLLLSPVQAAKEIVIIPIAKNAFFILIFFMCDSYFQCVDATTLIDAPSNLLPKTGYARLYSFDCNYSTLKY